MSHWQAIDLEPRPPNNPLRGMALATTSADQIRLHDSMLIAIASGSDKLLTVMNTLE